MWPPGSRSRRTWLRQPTMVVHMRIGPQQGTRYHADQAEQETHQLRLEGHLGHEYLHPQPAAQSEDDGAGRSVVAGTAPEQARGQRNEYSCQGYPIGVFHHAVNIAIG